MDDGLKQRLIGAIVLLALVVIFLPVLFDRESLEPIDRETQIPPEPEIETVVITPPVEPEVTSPAPEPEQMFIPDETQPVDEKPEEPGLNQQSLPKSWVIQVASFRKQELATKLRDELLQSDYPAYIRVTEKDNAPLTKVYVGPKLDKSALLQIKKNIEQKYKVRSIILDFTPSN